MHVSTNLNTLLWLWSLCKTKKEKVCWVTYIVIAAQRYILLIKKASICIEERVSCSSVLAEVQPFSSPSMIQMNEFLYAKLRVCSRPISC